MTMRHIIFHIDVNSAYLSWTAIEYLKRGEEDLRGIPCIIGGDKKSRHGVVLAKSIPAKAYGVRTGEPVVSAFRKCPMLRLEPPDHKMYARYSKRLMELLKSYTPDIEQLSIDECFLDFTDQESQSLIPQAVKSQHLFILKSFTKMYAIPGIRLGYGISGNKELIEKMEKSGPCWNVSVLASEAGIAALQEVEYCEQARRLICREREKLKEGLKIFGFRVWNGQADYLFFQTPGITDLYERLLPYGILIRRCSNYRGLDKTHYRIAVKSPEANEKLLEVLRKVLTEFYS